ncbi:HD domain-containing protein [Clostridium aminobutyricum]|uniref:HD domain-containing protein n=1 Tax=Clostridium aminobutyricum TaxID=33953 RepID=A0A939D7W5_CLOAM|nr:HD domain-containing protein [Clostridium aminobutyricum]MBN7772717.1 HD domain-containing protein [Clostridium aminobutyricum]
MIDKHNLSTISGKRFNPTKAKIGDIFIEDIAHALSLICRANGHFNLFYSIAQHSINCAKEAEARGYSKEVQLACLMHDASEAYIGDVISPLKRQLSDYVVYEKNLQNTILKALKLPALTPAEEKLVKEIDDCLLYHEFKTLHGDELFDYVPDIHIMVENTEVHHSVIEAQFLYLYYHYFSALG